MLSYIVRRLLSLIPTLFVIIVTSFLIIRLAPGSPFSSEKALAPEVRQALEAHYGLDQSLVVQLGRYLRNLAHGDLGLSTKYPQRTVNEIIWEGLPTTLTLGFLALLWALCIGLSIGIVCGMYRNTWIDTLGTLFCMLALSIPTFVLAPLLIAFFALQLRILPAAGWGHIQHVVLPALTLGTVYAAYIARLMRAGIIDVQDADYIRTAYAKGLSRWRILWRHVLPGALSPVVTYLGPAIANILVGSVVIEKIFNLPGIGPYFVDAAFNRDYFLVMGIVILESSLLLLMNVGVDIAYAWLDPRIRIS